MADSGPDPGAEPVYTIRSPEYNNDAYDNEEYDKHAQMGDPPTPASPSELSSPSLSWPSPLMSPFSPRREQGSLFKQPGPSSSPNLAKGPSGGQGHGGRTGRGALARRLNGLATRLQHAEGDDLGALHACIDRMELSLSGESPHNTNLPSFTPHDIPGDSCSHVDSHGHQGQFTPEHDIPRETSHMNKNEAQNTTEREKSGPKEPKMSLEHAQRIVDEANELNRGLQGAITSLRARQEESDHIHDLLITRAERAAQHIIYLEDKVKDLERERDEGEMEVLSLQIQLKAIEVQCATAASNRSIISDAAAGDTASAPADDDPDLRESISSWKAEWSELRRKRARKKDGAAEDGNGGNEYVGGSSAVATPEPAPLRRIQNQEGGGGGGGSINSSRGHRRGKLVYSSPTTSLRRTPM